MKWIAFKDEMPPHEIPVLVKLHPMGMYDVAMLTNDDSKEEYKPYLVICAGTKYEHEVSVGGPHDYTHWSLIEG